MIRPEVRGALWRWREVAAGAGVIAAGLWLISLGGYLLWPLGAVLGLAGLSLAVLALRRLRFAPHGEAPGLVQVDEGQISYLGPQIGGFVALRDLAEVRLIGLRGRRLWRLKQTDGQALLIPVEAQGAEALFDAFSALPGLSSASLLAALDPPPSGEGGALTAVGENRVVWRRPGGGGAIAGQDR